MEKFFAYQKDSRTPCKYGRKCFQTNKEHVDKYKHPPTKLDVDMEMKKKTRKRDSQGRVRTSTNSNEESSNANSRDNSNEEDHRTEVLNDMEVPDQSNNSIVESEDTSSNLSTNNQHSSTEYVAPSTREQTQQQQLLLTNTILEDCCGDDSIVPCTPTLFTPRRLDGETVSSPHVPSSSQVNRFTFVGESQASQITDSNDGEPGPSTLTNTHLPGNCGDPITWNKQITQLFLVGEMPKEFYDLWNFCKRQCPLHPEDALLPVKLKLVGPYDVLSGHINDFDVNDVEKNVLHWRYYYDPPEFQTILASTDSEFHIGYFRDQPLEMPVYVVFNDSGKDCIIQKLGKSLFLALRKYLNSMDSAVAHTLQKQLLAYEKRKVKQILDGRSVSSIAQTFHRAGIVVPYDPKTDVGYRPLSESGKTLRNILKCYQEASECKKVEAMDKLQPIINYANIASDECDFGTGLELGINLFCDGNPELHRICKQLLSTAYNLLRRPQFATIIKAHLNNRRKGQNMSILFIKVLSVLKMTSTLDSAKSSVKDSLYDESKPWYKFFAWAEAQTGVNRLNIFIGMSVFIMFYLLIGYGTLLLSNLIGFLYPAYASIKAVESIRKDDDTKWLTYWVVFSFITLVEFPAEILLQWIPFYSLIKSVFFVWCFIPIQNNGSVILYNRVIRPYFLKHQGDIDQAVNDLSKKATDMAYDKLIAEKAN